MNEPAVAFAPALAPPPTSSITTTSNRTVTVTPPRPRRTAWLGWTALIIAVVAAFAGLFLLGELPRREKALALAAEAARESTAKQRVRVVSPRPAPASESLRLQGTVAAARATGVYARIGGYVLKRTVDIGDRVEANQVLAEIEVPDAVQQLARGEGVVVQARAGIAQAKVALERARSDLERMRRLGPQVASQQIIDHRQADHDAAVADLQAAEARVVSEEAEVKRLRQQASFAQIIAPFAGTITGRTVEVGNLIPAGGGSTPLFQLAQLEPLRVLVEVPQAAIAGIEPGVTVNVATTTGGAVSKGTVARVARSLDADTRTMRAEIELPAGSTAFAPGMFVQTTLVVPLSRPLLVITADAILLSGKGTQVAVLDAEDRVRLKAVTVVSDTGTEVLLADGVSAKDRVVANPGGTLAEGTLVEVIPPPATPVEKPVDTGKTAAKP